VVVTDEHKDHIAGFDPDLFKNIKIENLWMNTAMDPRHPQADTAFELHRLATIAMRNIAALNVSLSPELEELVALYGIGNDGAMQALRNILPTNNGISPKYVHAGMTPAQLGLPLQNASIQVLGPEEDIDHFYLGKEIDETLHSLMATGAAFRSGVPAAVPVHPANMSHSDFRQLHPGCSRRHSLSQSCRAP
jgi:hypothetical protein